MRLIMKALSDREIAENAAQLARAAALIVTIVVIGIIGYRVLGGPDAGLLDAVYMTMITLTTVGYGEVIDMSGNPAGRVFTICLLFIGAGSFDGSSRRCCDAAAASTAKSAIVGSRSGHRPCGQHWLAGVDLSLFPRLNVML